MHKDLFSYDLPPELIAQQPPPRRLDARLLTLDAASGALTDRTVADVEHLTEPGDLLVLNDTRVIPARLFGAKATGGRVEVLIERMLPDEQVLAHIRSSKSPRIDTRVTIGERYTFRVIDRAGGLFRLLNESDTPVDEIVQQEGHVPLPPYIERGDTTLDGERYQTVYGRVPGAVAAPTAGLHFDDALLDRLRARGVDIGFVTLHVGAGTFQPVRVTDIETHTMHAERIRVPEAVCRQVARVRASERRVIAIGTTSVRALESAWADGRLSEYYGETDIFIYPGYRFNVVDAMLTNFHLPESTLLMLVSAFAGRENILHAYAHAIRERYRFFSYGDAMWITRGKRVSR